MTGALSRVLRAPGLVAGVAVLHLVLAAGVGFSARSAIGASMAPYALVDNSRLWFAVQELIGTSPGLVAPTGHLMAGSAVIALAFWTLLAAGILHRLRNRAPLPRLAAAAVRGLPGVLAVTVWHLLIRAVLLGVAGAAVTPLLEHGSWGPVGLLILVALLAVSTCALDLARCDVVLHGARRFHPKTAWRGFLHALRRPPVLVRSMLLSFGQWACVAALVWAALAGLHGGPAIWLARALAILGIVLGLTRLAVAVEAGPPQTPRLRRGLRPSPSLQETVLEDADDLLAKPPATT